MWSDFQQLHTCQKSHPYVQIFLEYDGIYIMLSIYRPVEQAVIGKQTDVRWYASW